MVNLSVSVDYHGQPKFLPGRPRGLLPCRNSTLRYFCLCFFCTLMFVDLQITLHRKMAEHTHGHALLEIRTVCSIRGYYKHQSWISRGQRTIPVLLLIRYLRLSIPNLFMLKHVFYYSTYILKWILVLYLYYQNTR